MVVAQGRHGYSEIEKENKMENKRKKIEKKKRNKENWGRREGYDR